MSGDVLQTEFAFTLPQGYVDDEGVRHREGVMRLATAADEIKPLKDPRVQSNGGYLSVLLLARVITQLGSLEDVTPHVVENLFVGDLEYLHSLYDEINEREAGSVDAVCPACGEEFSVHPDRQDNTAPVESGLVERIRTNSLLSSITGRLSESLRGTANGPALRRLAGVDPDESGQIEIDSPDGSIDITADDHSIHLSIEES